MRNFWLCFVPLFVAVDVVGLLPIFIGLTDGMEKRMRRRVVGESVLTALAVAAGFVALGKLLFRLLGVTVGDFLIAGGTLLFVIALADLVASQKLPQRAVHADDHLGAVPLGVPLIVGPAVLTTSFVLVDAYGIAATLAAAVANILIVGLAFRWSDAIVRIIGRSGARVFSKLVSLILAAMAVMYIRQGIIQTIGVRSAAQGG